MIGVTETITATSDQACDLRIGPPARLEPATCCLQDSSGPSTGYCRVVSLQLTSDGWSSQCAPVGPSSARWNDTRNDILAVSSEEDPPQSVVASLAWLTDSRTSVAPSLEAFLCASPAGELAKVQLSAPHVEVDD
jgi:hypothetical protein